MDRFLDEARLGLFSLPRVIATRPTVRKKWQGNAVWEGRRLATEPTTEPDAIRLYTRRASGANNFREGGSHGENRGDLTGRGMPRSKDYLGPRVSAVLTRRGASVSRANKRKRSTITVAKPTTPPVAHMMIPPQAWSSSGLRSRRRGAAVT